MDFTQSMDNGYMIPTSVAVGSGEATDIRCVCDTVEDFKSFLDTTGMELRYEGLVTYEKVNKLLKVYKGNDMWQTIGEGGGSVDTSNFITLTQLSQQLSNYYTKAQTDSKILEEIAKAQAGGGGENNSNTNNNVLENEFYGKVANFLGDSQTEVNGHKTKIYHDWVMEYLGLSKVNNYGKSGSTIAKKDITSMCVRYADMDNTAELICVMGGVNDVWKNSPMGAFGDTDITTFYGAMEVMCDGLLTKYPGKTIIFITPTEQAHPNCIGSNTTGYTATDFANAMKRVCAKYSIPVFDANTCSGIYPINQANSDLYTTDRLHLNTEANKVLGVKLAKFILNGSITNTIIEDSPDNEGDDLPPSDSPGNEGDGDNSNPSNGDFVGKTFTATGLHSSGKYHFTLLVSPDGFNANDVIEVNVALSSVVGFASIGTTSSFSDNTGELTNGKFIATISGAPKLTGDFANFKLEYTLNTAVPAGTYVKLPIPLNPDNGGNERSFQIDSLSVRNSTKGNELEILQIGGFFDMETFTIE